jgi:hypothetical protein
MIITPGTSPIYHRAYQAIVYAKNCYVMLESIVSRPLGVDIARENGRRRGRAALLRIVSFNFFV